MPVTLPIEVVCKTMQTRKPGKGEAGGGSGGGGGGNAGVFGVISAILKEKGVGGFYRGLSAYIVLCLKPAIQFTIYEQVCGSTRAQAFPLLAAGPITVGLRLALPRATSRCLALTLTTAFPPMPATHARSSITHQLRLALLKRRAGPGGAANNKMKQLSTVQVCSSERFSYRI